MEHDLDPPPVYHGGSRLTPAVIDLLCDLMGRTLNAYCELAVDIARDRLDDEFDTWTDFDICESYSVVDVGTVANARLHYLPDGHRGLVVCYDYGPVAAIATLDVGAELIGLGCGRPVRLVAEHLPTGRFWTPVPLDGPPDPPTEPTPTRPQPRRRHLV